jgi:hypothetical protein
MLRSCCAEDTLCTCLIRTSHIISGPLWVYIWLWLGNVIEYMGLHACWQPAVNSLSMATLIGTACCQALLSRYSNMIMTTFWNTMYQLFLEKIQSMLYAPSPGGTFYGKTNIGALFHFMHAVVIYHPKLG